MKRLSTSDPLTADDVAERLDKAAQRVVRIMLDVRKQEGDLMHDVMYSRYSAGSLQWLLGELQTWGIKPYTPPAEPGASVVAGVPVDSTEEAK